MLWVALSHSAFAVTTPLVPFFFVFALDSIRTYYFNARLPAVSVPSLYLQLLLIFAFIATDGTAVGGILLVILIAESLLAYPRPNGEHIFLLSLIGFPAVGAASLYWRSALTWSNMASILINSLFFIFAFAVCYMARRQLEEKERAEDALEQLDRSRADLEEAYQKLLEISKERERLAALEERTRLARELHDTLAHSLTAIVVSLEAGKRLLDKDPVKALAEMNKSQEQARKGLEEVRLTVKALRPGDLDQIDLKVSIMGLARGYEGSGVAVCLQIDEGLNLPRAVETALYRIVQESITNSVRHGGANLIEVFLKRNDRGFSLEVKDDGKGCPAIREGYGLKGICERAEAFGGRVTFTSETNKGFTVSLIVEGLA